ncbi:MAG: hypothetical protein C3F07_08140 [Anaerolineales bacterium]|nr:hypothetical protein [Anaerolineae bacterium]PWB74249.1 MAG: hypothetical protein C3F07_08140 [Anaerolineales bacterium]
MDFSIELLQDPPIINVTVAGQWDSKTDNDMALDIMKKVSETKVDKVLVDLRELQFEIPVVDIFQRAKDLREQRRGFAPVSAKVALVYRPVDQKMEEDFIFFENTSQNRGLPYRVFQRMESALAWLTK